MSNLFATELRLLFEINAARQAEMDTLFISMPDYPSDSELTLLHDTVERSVPEAQAVLAKIEELFEERDRQIPSGMLSNILMHKAVLKEQIRNDSKLTVYLESEYKFLCQTP